MEDYGSPYCPWCGKKTAIKAVLTEDKERGTTDARIDGFCEHCNCYVAMTLEDVYRRTGPPVEDPNPAKTKRDRLDYIIEKYGYEAILSAYGMTLAFSLREFDDNELHEVIMDGMGALKDTKLEDFVAVVMKDHDDVMLDLLEEIAANAAE